MTPSEHKDKKNVDIAYGKSRIKLTLPSSFDLIEPKFVPKLKEEKYQIIKLLKNPIGSAPLRKKVNKSSKIAISVWMLRTILLKFCLHLLHILVKNYGKH